MYTVKTEFLNMKRGTIMTDIILTFKAFIEQIVKFFQDLVAKIRAMNDNGGKLPEDGSNPVA